MATTTRAATAPAIEPMDVDSESELLVVETRSTSPQKTTEEILDEAVAGDTNGPTAIDDTSASVGQATVLDGTETPPILDEVGEDETLERKQSV
jgi:hypothetical protein